MASFGLALGIPTIASAGFLANNQQYKVKVTGGCMAFGNCTTQTQNVGTGSFTITTDATGNAYTVGSYSGIDYTGTPGGLFKTAGPVAGNGTVAASGQMDLNFTGRTGNAQFFPQYAGAAWNLDNNTKVSSTGVYEGYTTASDHNLNPNTGAVGLTLAGSNLVATPGGFSGKLVSVGNVGKAWIAFDGTPYSEVYNIILTEFNAPPVAKNDSSSVAINSTVKILVVQNDSDVDVPASPPLLVPTDATVNLPSPKSAKGGVLTNNGDGSITYSSVGTGLAVGQSDTFQYTLTDTTGKTSNPATVTIQMTASLNTPPVATGGAVTVLEDSSVSILASNVATDVDIPAQTLTFLNVSSAQHGVITTNSGSTSLTYTPNLNYSGSDQFSYKISDGFGGTSNQGTVNITITHVNHNPVCPDVALSTGTDKVLTINAATRLIAKCTDIDGDKVSFSTETQPVNSGAMIADNGAGTLTYTPAKGFKGNDSFTFTVIDGKGGSATATATIKVGPQFGNFTMLTPAPGGATFGGTNDVVFTWDGKFDKDASDTNFSHMTITSAKPQQFFNFIWTAHNIRVFGPGTYTFDTTCTVADYSNGITKCNHPLQGKQTKQFITMKVGPNQVGAHILFDWNKAKNIDVVNVWDKNAVWNRHGKTGTQNQLFAGAAGVAPDPAAKWAFVSTDVNGDGFNGSPMIDGPFIGYYANFNSIVNLPLGSTIGKANTVDVKPVAHTAGNTKISSNKIGSNSGLASLNLLTLFATLSTLLSLRWLGKKHKQ